MILSYCFIFSLPGFYLVFQTPLGGKMSFTSNISYTILTNLSIIFFFITFFIFNVENIKNYKKIFIYLNVKEIIFLMLVYILLISTYEIPATLVGGGFFYKISLFFFKNEYLFFAICLFAIISIYLILKFEKKLFFLLFLSNLTAIAYFTSQKYFEPLVIILILVFCKNYLTINLVYKTKNIFFFYLIILSYYFTALINSYYFFTKNLNIN